jgi:hypothetical protein
MSDAETPKEIFDALDAEIRLDELEANKRIAVRYRRKDIKAVIKIHSFFYPRLQAVILNDVSSKGAGIICPVKLSAKTRVSLYLLFNDGKRFDIEALVVYGRNDNHYGLKFDQFNDQLAEHLLQTQTDLKFS